MSNIKGAKTNDTLTGTSRDDTIKGGDGDDTIFGLGGKDNIDGGKGDDLIDGGAGDDRLSGNKGDDVLIGGAGDDYIDGGKGNDVARYTGNFADYQITRSGGNDNSGKKNGKDDDDDDDDKDNDQGYVITVKDLRSGSPDGTDTLRRIESIQFADQTIYLDGRDNAAVIGTPTVSSVTEDVSVTGGKLKATGSIPISDFDPGQNSFKTTVSGVGSPLGTLEMKANGKYTYAVLNSLVQHLGTGATATDTFTVTSVDGTTKNVSFTINGTNDAPTLATSGATVAEGGTLVLSATNLAGADVDNTAAQLSFTVGALPARGTLFLNNVALAVNATFTQADVVAGNLTYTHDGSETLSDSLKVSLSDGTASTGQKTLALTVTPVNDAPTLATSDATVAEGGTLVLSATNLAGADVDNTAAQLSFTVGALPARGTLFLNNVALAVNATFTQADVIAGNLTYTHDGSETLSDSLKVTLSDGTASTGQKTLALTVTPVNDASVISGVSGPLQYTVGQLNPQPVAPALALSDVDSGLVTSAKVVISAGFSAGNDVLAFQLPLVSPITGGYVSGTGILSFDGPATLAEYQAALASVTFSTSTIGLRTVSFTVFDGPIASLTVDTSNISLESLTTDSFKIPGEAIGDASGFGMRGAGDFNGDGYDDIIIGAPFSDANGGSSGRSYVVFGGPSPFPSEVPLSALNGSNGFRLTGAASGDASGWAVSDAGDVNGDGFADVIVGAPYASPNVRPYSGAGYVVFGTDQGFPANVSALGGTNGFRIAGAAAYDGAGITVNAAGDVNGDGFDDVIVGAPYASPNAPSSGAGYVVFGKATGFAPTVELSALGSGGFRIPGLSAYDRAGVRMDGAGDVNGDGFDDLIIAAVGSAATDPGAVYVVFGKTGGFAEDLDLFTLGSGGFRISGAAAGDHLGWGLSGAGDINGDGFADVIVSSHFASVNGVSAGAAYVVFGTDLGFPANLNVSALVGTNGFRIAGAAAGDQAGFSVSAAGDFNGDGFDDVIVGAPGAKTGTLLAGQSYVVFGKASGFLPSLDLSNLGTDGFRVSGVANGDDSGYQVGAAGDVNGDGFDDIAVSSSRASPNGQTYAGETYVIFGANLIVGGETYLGGSNGDTLTGTAANEVFVGGRGSDTMRGNGGKDTFSGGAGDDTVHLGVSGQSVIDFVRINGGSGFDTLVLDGSGVTLDFTASGAERVRGKVQGIERIDLTGSGDNTLKLDVRDVLNMSDSTNRLYVMGNAGDSVISTSQGWVADGQVTLEGTLYNSYIALVGVANLLVDTELSATIS